MTMLIRFLTYRERSYKYAKAKTQLWFWTETGGIIVSPWFSIQVNIDLNMYTYLYTCIHISIHIHFVVVQTPSRVGLFVTLWTATQQASLSFTISRSLLKLMSMESVMPSNYLILCYPLLLLPSIFPSIRVFSNESALRIRWPKYWNFSFSISPSNEYSGLISFRMDLFDLLTVQGTLKRLLWHHSLKASILWCSSLVYWKGLGRITQ